MFLTTIKTYSQDNSLTGNWVAVDCEPIGKDFVRMINGLILSFGNDSVKITTVLSKTDTVASFKLKGKKLLIAGKKFGVINKITNDSIVVISNNNRRTIFRKINPLLREKTAINLTTNPWYLYNPVEQEFKQRITFFDSLARQSGWRICFSQTPGHKFKRQEIRAWSLKTLGTDIIITTQRGLGGMISIYQVIKNTIGKLELKDLSDPDNNTLLLEKIDQRRNQETTFHLITNKIWNTESVLSYSTQSEEPIQILDSTIYIQGLINYTDSTLIKLNELVENQISMKFDATHSFELLVNNRPFQNGVWHFSLDGEYIILDRGLKPENYIEIIELTNKSLTIGKQDELNSGIDNSSIIYYYKLRLN